MPIHKRGDSWQVTVCHNGQIHRRSSRHWTKAQAREVEEKLRADLFALDMGRQPDRTFNDAVDRWLREVVPRMKARSAIEARQNTAHIAPYIDNRKLTDAKDVAAAIRGAWPDLSPSTVNRRLAVVSRLCHLAVNEWGWLDTAPTITMLPEQKRERFLSREQVEAIAARCGHHGPAVLLAAYTGVRIGHLLRLTAADYADGCLLLDRSSKTGVLQAVPVHKRVRDIAAQLPLTSTYPGFYKAFKAACHELGIDARPHDLRHTLASWLVQSGAGAKVVQDMLGHAQISTTQRYMHLRTVDLEHAIDKIA